MAFPNVYTHRKVAETKPASCDICFKLSSSVLITSDNKDWFYICPSHLKDTGFCIPMIDRAAIEERKKQELEAEIERVKQEYEEKQKKKKDKASADSAKKDEADGKKNKEDKSGEKADKTQDKTEPTQGEGTEPSSVDDEEPRVFELKNTFYQQRLNRKRQAEIAKRHRERMKDPNLFPSVPKNLPS
ncbi:DUF1742-domain-containing protein [Trichocladium antarcticum]|uniref:DUF1742-domain-containing protein n=1 Tax=Trichocladium antarcticum TaxID=1450529 RepID=A0AAN6UIE4_9PEZI|nr:DUF1742-domain-containing protein [Trichocladium antarcticum]